MTADRFLAIPFVSKGRSYAGADCWGLLWLWYRDMLGIDLPPHDTVPASALRTIGGLVAHHKRDWLSVAVPRDGDAVVMRAWTQRSTIEDAHVGVVVNRRCVLHTEERTGPRLQRLSDPDVRARVIEYRRHPDAA